jgi:GNAT superfamily N-acetyltransferase
VKIREILPCDAESYRELLHDAYSGTERYGIHFEAQTADLDTVRSYIASDLIYVLLEDGNFASSIIVRLPWGRKPGPGPFPHLGRFATAGRFKNRGLGRQIFEWLEQNILVRMLKAPACTLGTADNHPWLLDLYKRYGFYEICRKNITPDHTTVFLQKDFASV